MSTLCSTCSIYKSFLYSHSSLQVYLCVHHLTWIIMDNHMMIHLSLLCQIMGWDGERSPWRRELTPDSSHCLHDSISIKSHIVCILLASFVVVHIKIYKSKVELKYNLEAEDLFRQQRQWVIFHVRKFVWEDIWILNLIPNQLNCCK